MLPIDFYNTYIIIVSIWVCVTHWNNEVKYKWDNNTSTIDLHPVDRRETKDSTRFCRSWDGQRRECQSQVVKTKQKSITAP